MWSLKKLKWMMEWSLVCYPSTLFQLDCCLIPKHLIHSSLKVLPGIISFQLWSLGGDFGLVRPRILHESNQIVSLARIEIAGVEFIANLIVLKLGNDVNVILGMKWMVKHQCVIRCIPRSVEIHHSSGKLVTLYASQSQQVTLNSLRTKPNTSKCVELVPVVCEFPNVFPEELMVMPPK